MKRQSAAPRSAHAFPRSRHYPPRAQPPKVSPHCRREQSECKRCKSCTRSGTQFDAKIAPRSRFCCILQVAQPRNLNMLLQGIFPPITTPFYPDGNIYFKKLEHNVERYSKTPVAGLTVLGSTGEAVMLSDEERRAVLKAAREAAAPAKVLIAGTGIESAIETLRLTDYAAELGYDAALIRTPHFYKKVMHPANMLAFYRTVADRSPLPVMIYNVPGF